MAKQTTTGLLLNGSVKSSGVTFYTRNGQTVVRSAHSVQPRRRTRKQFDMRMRMKHSIALWKMLKYADPMFSGGKNPFTQFASMANLLPVVYLSCRGGQMGASLLLPDMPVSAGPLPTVTQRLDTVDGHPALVTGLKASALQNGDTMRLYTIRQDTTDDTPRIRATVREVAMGEFREVDGCLALVGDEFADTMKGWALVRVHGDRCSTQAVQTNCEYYRQFTTEAALKEAAQSYGGLTDK